jgi:FkbH-like protein
MQKLDELELSDYFLYPQINWRPKSENIRTIAERLNVGLDSLAFVDDNPFELEQVRHSLPEVLGVSAETALSVLSDRRFQGSSSAESRRRRQFYREAIAREEAQQQYGDNYAGFLASCGIVLEVAAYSDQDFERISELVQRTNQLNFSGHKYTRSQLNEIVTDSRLDKYVLKSSDNYGTYGTVGFSIVEQATRIIQVRDFMLSCRVQGRFIEQAFFHHLANHHNPDAAKTIWINFRVTSRNKPAQQVLETLGFRKSGGESDQFLEGMVHTSADSLSCDFIQVRCSASRGAPTITSGIAADLGRHPASRCSDAG